MYICKHHQLPLPRTCNLLRLLLPRMDATESSYYRESSSPRINKTENAGYYRQWTRARRSLPGMDSIHWIRPKMNISEENVFTRMGLTNGVLLKRQNRVSVIILYACSISLKCIVLDPATPHFARVGDPPPRDPPNLPATRPPTSSVLFERHIGNREFLFSVVMSPRLVSRQYSNIVCT